MNNSSSASALPAPPAEAIEHSERLQALIRQEIETANGVITFARFMELALYAPGLGYYTAGARKFGEAGDFITAPELSPIFSRCLARQCQQVLDAIGHGDILEFGAGTGVMASDILLELESNQSLPGQYFILELSPDLKRRQRETLSQRVPHLLGRVCWLDSLPESGFHGVVLANEVVDAMPVHLIQRQDDAFVERYVADQNGRFVWQAGPLSNPRLEEAVAGLTKELGEAVFCPSYLSEVNLVQQGWLASIAAMLERGAVLIIDYGFPQSEYYHPDRTSGTLMCHYRHRSHGDPLILVGLQDITAHVDFTAVAMAANEAGFEILGYTSQAQFLLGCGLGELLEEYDPQDTRHYLEVTQAVKKLTMPSEMGELFKVIALGADLNISLNGFFFQNRRNRL